MIRQVFGGLRPALAWFVFPLVPAVLGRSYHATFNLALGQASGPDPRDWNWFAWVLLLGPLLGYGFLAGATTLLDDPPDGGRGIRSWSSRRGVWVALGPWTGFVVLGGLYLLIVWTVALVNRLVPATREWSVPLPPNWPSTWWGWPLAWALVIGGVAVFGYGWILVAVAAVRRGRAAGLGRRVIERGLAGAFAFVATLFGSFWAITEIWRSYFFDKAIMPIVLIGLTLTLTVTGGCGSPLTYGEHRRRELFGAMLTAWLLGLALAWRWWGRRRPRG